MPKQSSTPRVITKKHLARIERERRQTRLILIVASLAIVIVAGLLGYGLYRYNLVAEANGVKIWAGEWQERVRFQRAQMINVYSQYAFYQQNFGSFGADYTQQLQQIQTMLDQPQIVGQQALDQMRDEILIRQEAQKRGITASPDEIDKLFQENFGFYPNGSPTPTVTPTGVSLPTMSSEQLTLYPPTLTPTVGPTFTPAPTETPDPSATATPTAGPATPTLVPEPPTATATPFTLEGYQSEYQKMMETYKGAPYNISEKTIRSVYEAEILRNKLMDDLSKDIPHTQEQVWARHILVETEAEAAAVEAQLKQGIPFARVAERFSKDTGSGASGGDLGWHTRDYFVKEFSDAAFSQPVGEIGQPVKSQFGYHIIQVLGRQELPLDASQLQQEKQKIFDDWLKAAREKATYVTYDVWKERVPSEPTLQQGQ